MTWRDALLLALLLAPPGVRLRPGMVARGACWARVTAPLFTSRCAPRSGAPTSAASCRPGIPSSFSGTPLLAAYRPGAFYPLMPVLALLPPFTAFQALVLAVAGACRHADLRLRAAARARAAWAPRRRRWASPSARTSWPTSATPRRSWPLPLLPLVAPRGRGAPGPRPARAAARPRGRGGAAPARRLSRGGRRRRDPRRSGWRRSLPHAARSDDRRARALSLLAVARRPPARRTPARPRLLAPGTPRARGAPARPPHLARCPGRRDRPRGALRLAHPRPAMALAALPLVLTPSGSAGPRRRSSPASPCWASRPGWQIRERARSWRTSPWPCSSGCRSRHSGPRGRSHSDAASGLRSSWPASLPQRRSRSRPPSPAPSPQVLAGAVGVLALALILLLRSRRTPAIRWRPTSFLLAARRPPSCCSLRAAQAWAGAPTADELGAADSHSRSHRPGHGTAPHDERTLSLVEAWPRGAEADLACANRADLAGRRNVNGYDPLVPARAPRRCSTA